MSAEKTRIGKHKKNLRKGLDTNSRRGRKGTHPPADVLYQRAENYKRTLGSKVPWPILCEGLRRATTAEDVANAWTAAGLSDGEGGIGPLSVIAPIILKVVSEPRFWNKKDSTQVRHLADSLASFTGSPRRSRDLVGSAREDAKRLKDAFRVVAAEPVWRIECSCGRRGLSKGMACPKCGAQIPSALIMNWRF